MEVRINPLHPDVKIPEYKTSGAAGADLHAYIHAPVEVRPGERVIIPTGISLEIPPGRYGRIADRSSTAKAGLHVVAGVCDSDYRGEVKVMAITTDDEYIIEPGERIAQIIFEYCDQAHFVVSALNDTQRGAGALGSTGRA